MKEHIKLNNQVMQRGTDGFVQLEKDKQAIEEFQKEVDLNIVSFGCYIRRIDWLIKHNYYENFFIKYKPSDVLKISEMVYSYNFKFQSYMAITKFYHSYALKTKDKTKYLERYEDRIIACALYLGQGDVDFAYNLAKAMIEQQYQPATPTFQNAGIKHGGKMISCFLLEFDDSLNSIMYNISTSAQLSKIGGGVALDLSRLRARSESIKDVVGVSSGVVPVMKLLEDTFSYVNQLGQRPGAGVANLNIFHWDIEEFLSTKKISGDEKSRMKTLSIGVIVPDKFIELAREDKDAYIFAPHTVYKATGKYFDEIDFDKEYEELVSNPNIKKRKINPRDLLTEIAKTQFESGYPYMTFTSTANKVHALKGIGRIKQSNLCQEIMQLQEVSTINDYGVEDEIKRDICCNLGSLNIVNVMEHKNFEEIIKTSMLALTSVSEMAYVENAPSVNKANEELHAVGLGAMNLHGFFAKNRITYEGEEAKDFVNVFFMLMNYYSLKASMEIAKEKGESFVGFKDSEYYNGSYFEKYTSNNFFPVTEKVKELFDGIYIPTSSDWLELSKQVKENGLYNAYRLAIAPTQSIGYIQNATPSVAPVVDLIERRTYGDSTTYYPMPYLTRNNVFFYKSAYNMDMMKMIDLISVIQEHIDQGISTILYVDSNTSTKDLVKYYMYAHHKGLKSLYYTRTKNLGISECESCAV